MKQVGRLFRLLFDEKFDFFKKNTNRKKAFSSILKYFIVFFATTAICYYAFFRIRLYGINLDEGVLGLIILVTQIIAFFMSLGGIISNLYNSKDSELLMCMPVTHNQIFITKLMVMYVSEFIHNLLYFSPIFISFGLNSNMNSIYYILMPLYLLILPIVPMALAAFVSVPFYKVFSFIKERLALAVITVLVLSGTGIYLYVNLITKIFTNINIVGQQLQVIIKINKWLRDFSSSNYLFTKIATSMNGNMTYITLPILIITSAILMVLSSLLVKLFYYKMAMKNSESRLISHKKSNSRKESALKSLVRKEFYTVFRTPGYIFQYFIYTLLMPLIVFVYDRLLITITVSSVGETMIGGAHVLILSILALLSCTISASAISREGGTYYIMKTSPVSFKKQVLAKVIFNLSIVLIFVFITMIATLIFIDINPFYIIFSTIIVSFLSIGQICWNFDMDLRNPTLDWYDSGEITSISKNTSNSIILSLVVSVVVAYLVFLFARYDIVWYLVTFFAILFAIGRIKLLRARVNYYFRNNEM